MNTKRDGVEVMIIETGEKFNSIQACADYLGVNVSWLGRVVRGQNGLCTVHGYHVIRTDDICDETNYSDRDHFGRPGVKVRVLETGEIFDSITECANTIGGSPGTIHDILHGNRKRQTHKGFHFEMV